MRQQLLWCLFAIAGCSAKAYQGTLPDGQSPARVAFYAASPLLLEGMKVDAYHAGVLTRGIDIAPGAHKVSTRYKGERWICEGERQACRVVLFGGVCKADLIAENDGRYRTRVEPVGDEKAQILIIDIVNDTTQATIPCESTRRSVRYRDGSIVPGF